MVKQKMDDLVSILIPVFKRGHLIAETIESAQAQTYKNIEIVIVDNNSPDNTWEIIKCYAGKDSRIKAFRNDYNVGPVENWKRCFDYASGTYGKILWSDDLIHPGFIERILPFLKNNTDTAFIFTRAELFYNKRELKFDSLDNLNIKYLKSDEYINNMLLADLAEKYPISPGCAIFRLDDLRKNLIINIPNKMNSQTGKHGIGSDLLVFLMIAKDYKKIGYTNDYPLSFFRVHDGSITVASDNIKLKLFYNIAKSFFVENYIKDKKIKMKFNSKLLLDLNRIKLNNKNISFVSDFYMNNEIIKFDLVWIIKEVIYELSDKNYRLLKKICKFMLKLFLKLFNRKINPSSGIGRS